MNIPIVIITGADSLTGLTALRSLRSCAVECWGIAEDTSKPCCYSRYWKHVYNINGSDDEQIDRLIKLGVAANLISDQKPLLIFSQDEWVVRANAYRVKLSKCFRLVLPDDEAVHRLMDKTIFHDWAEDNAFPVPLSKIASNNEELEKLSRSTDFPFVIKPLVRTKQWDSVFVNKKIIKIESQDDLDRLSSMPVDMFELSPKYILQRWIKGSDHDVKFCLFVVDEDGEMKDMFLGEKIWQWPPLGGSTTICRDYSNQNLVELSKNVAKAAGFKGLGSIEYKQDSVSGDYYITEPTVGRNDFQSYVAVRGGCNLTKTLVESVFKFDVGDVEPKSGVIWFDEVSTLRRAKNNSLSFFCLLKIVFSNYKRKRTYLMADRDDLEPFKRMVKEWQ